jgi:hypothetical protein
LRRAAVDKQLDSRNEAGVIRSQKECRLSDFVRLADPTHRDDGHELIFDFLGDSDEFSGPAMKGAIAAGLGWSH